MAKDVSTTLPASLRTDFGKGAARRTRREGKIPAVVYGPGREPAHVALPEHELVLALRKYGKNALLTLDIDGEGKQLALTRAVQIDYVHRIIEHVDFLAVTKGQHQEAEVALTLTGSVNSDEFADLLHTTLHIEAAVEDLPEHIDVNVDGRHAGDQILAKDLVLPQGVKLAGDPDAVVVMVSSNAGAIAAGVASDAAEGAAAAADAAPAAEDAS
jgi:large subunit ribosomal protein L25